MTVAEKALANKEAYVQALRASVPEGLRPGCPGIITAKLAVMAKVKGAKKDRVNKHQGYEYVGHDDVTEALQDAFVEYGIAQSVSVLTTTRDKELLSVYISVRWTAEKDGTFEEVQSFAEVTAKAKTGRPDSVEAGAAISYAVKTAQLKNFMLVGGNVPDPEENEGRNDAPAQREEKRDTKKSNRPEKGGVEDAEVSRWLETYSKVGTQEQLDEARQKLGQLANFLTDEQYDRLADADQRAEAFVKDKVPF